MNKVPKACFNAQDFPPEARLNAFRRLTESAYQLWAIGDALAFDAKAIGYQVGGLLFNDVYYSPSRFVRSAEHLSGSNNDYLELHAQLSGSELVEMQHGIIRLQPHHIYLRDWSFPFESHTSATQLMSVLIPRHLLRSSAILCASNPVLSWPMAEPKGRLLMELWLRVVAEFDEADLGTAEALCRALLGFLDGLIGSAEVGPEHDHVELRTLEQYLQAQLRGDVGVEQLCQRFEISRATVFRLFKQHGGVVRYLNRLRLERCYLELRDADPQQTSVNEVASGWGYTEPRSFLRAFRAQFGVAPSEVLGTTTSRAATPHESEAVHASEQVLIGEYAGWLRMLGPTAQG